MWLYSHEAPHHCSEVHIRSASRTTPCQQRLRGKISYDADCFSASEPSSSSSARVGDSSCRSQRSRRRTAQSRGTRCALWLSILASGLPADTAQELARELCVLVHRRDGVTPTGKLLQAIRRTWGLGRGNHTFLVQSPQPPASWPPPSDLPEGLAVLREWAWRLPDHCSWVLKVPAESYVNVPRLNARLRCFDDEPSLEYLGVPKIVSLGGGDSVFRVADDAAGIVLKRSLLKRLPYLMDHCITSSDFMNTFIPSHSKYEDVALGACLWMHNVPVHSWMDPGDEVFYQHAANVFTHPGFERRESSFSQTLDKHGEEASFGSLQCVFLVVGITAGQMGQLDAMIAKSGRWFKNIACVSGGLTYPELTSARSIVNGKAMTEPIFSKTLRIALQQCYLKDAFAKVIPHPQSKTVIESPAALHQEWRNPAATLSPAAARLSRGGHKLCIFVVSTRASEKHLLDAESVLRSWGSAGEGLPGVEVFLVGRQLFKGRESVAMDDSILELLGDVDLGFLYNTVRVLYLWRYLSAHHVSHCEWFMKADADTFINTFAVKERLDRYFDHDKPLYLGTTKVTRLGSGRRLPFAYNIAILSRALLKEAAEWFPICVDDLVLRKYGKGAEDIDLAYCLDMHGGYAPSRLGGFQEVLSRAMLRASSSNGTNATEDAGVVVPAAERIGEDVEEAISATVLKDVLTSSGACTLFVHPVHGQEMSTMHGEVLRFRKELPEVEHVALNQTTLTIVGQDAPLPRRTGSCDWPAPQASDSKLWQRYMKQEWRGSEPSTNCWMGEFTWTTCCDTRIWGPVGHTVCWDEEYTYERCCRQNRARLEPAPSAPVAAQPLPTTTTATTTTSTVITTTTTTSTTTTTPIVAPSALHETPTEQVEAEAQDNAPAAHSIKPFQNPADEKRGNPKCWSAETAFRYDDCCIESQEDMARWSAAQECWSWPYTFGFCCRTPVSAREPIQVGGLPPDLYPGQRKRTSRCPEKYDKEYLACTKSLDELGALFELSVIGTGDKASGWHDYLGAYERFLMHLPLSATLLELGVRMGCSMAMWSEYFPFGTVVGVDKNLDTFLQRKPLMENEHGAFTNNNVHVLEGNASDPSILEILHTAGLSGAFADAIVDDANHWARDQLLRFEMFFPEVLRPGGVYIVEDVHIQEPYNHDGIEVRDYFAKLSASPYLIETEILVGRHQIEAVRRQSKDWRHQVESVSFLRDMVIITKSAG